MISVLRHMIVTRRGDAPIHTDTVYVRSRVHAAPRARKKETGSWEGRFEGLSGGCVAEIPRQGTGSTQRQLLRCPHLLAWCLLSYLYTNITVSTALWHYSGKYVIYVTGVNTTLQGVALPRTD